MENRFLSKARLGMAGAAFFAGLGGLLSLGVLAGTTAAPAGATTTASVYTPLTPVRIADTRSSTSPALPNAGQTLGAGKSDVVAIPTADVPAGATAVALNVTAINATEPSYFTVYPTGDTSTNFSNLNFVPGDAQPNLVISPIGGTATAPSVSIYNFAGTADFAVDLEGYFTPSTGATGTGHFFPLTPSRITDTRTGSNEPNAGKTLSANSSISVPVAGVGGVPTTGVSAVELNVTATDTTQASYFTVYPNSGTIPTASNVNWNAGQVVANRVIVPLNSAGAVNVYNYAGSADLVVDVDGYFSSTSSSGGSLFVPVAPARISDTRAASGQPNSGSPVGPAGTETVQVTGAGGVPAISPTESVTGAVLNVTEADSTAPSFLTVFPAAAIHPTSSDVNFAPPTVLANDDLVGLSSTGTVDIYNNSGNTDVVVDVFGYFVPATPIPVNAVAVAAASATTPADGSTTDAITVAVDTPAFAPVGSDPVTLTVSPAATCGTVSPATGTTNVSGGFAATYTASVYTANCTITATEADQGQTGSVTINQTVVSGYVISLSAASSTVAPSATTALFTNVSDNGVAAPADVVSYTVSGTCGAVTPTSETTSSGFATANYTAVGAGTCTITATEANGGKHVNTVVTTS
jgi:hypothetical protein